MFADRSLDFIHYDLFNFRITNVELHEEVLRLCIPKIKNEGLIIWRDLNMPDIASALHNLGQETVRCRIANGEESQKLLYSSICHDGP